ncbi:Hint domain-containing protein [Falsirhodobacter sp. 20TX0035]|uniref:Hint domain-containing protein n=1 Tax=Falsirhodobacter sp. 20TX0035 TaxID=3022019 RepID=UPI00232D99F1|nr:Hint domain-containing protein [Falsirhodobacter sp. 20TX0035]MDB6455100.1 Hint domain-containing protein [Falsirhodobacter sp. 20TX0035]
MTTFTIRGDQLVVDPSVSTDAAQGTATVQWGRQVWSKDHIIEITAVNTSGAELTGSSGITAMRVYDASETLVAEYLPMNPGQSASLSGDASSLGDGYARINTSVMQPSPGSPWIGPIMITNGDRSFSSLPTTFHTGSGAYDITPAGTQAAAPPPCFGPDVIIHVANRGAIPVRALQAGDSILTSDGPQEVLWTGQRHCACATKREWPIEIEGELFSPLHRIFWKGKWAKAKHLAEAGRAVVRGDLGAIDYHHVLLPEHAVVLTARNRVESLLLTPYSLDLWGQAPLLRKHDGRSATLAHDEWRRAQILRGV